MDRPPVRDLREKIESVGQLPPQATAVGRPAEVQHSGRSPNAMRTVSEYLLRRQP